MNYDRIIDHFLLPQWFRGRHRFLKSQRVFIDDDLWLLRGLDCLLDPIHPCLCLLVVLGPEHPWLPLVLEEDAEFLGLG